MAVEILILSGSRQGERQETDLREFRVGGSAGCEVWFDPDKDPTAKDRVALFRLEDDGWRIRNAGHGSVLMHEQPVEGIAPIRSGDIIRLSESGPDFCFTILARAAQKPVGAAAPSYQATSSPASQPARPIVAPVQEQASAPIAAVPVAAVPVAVAQPLSVSSQVKHSNPALWLGGSVVVCALLLCGSLLAAVWLLRNERARLIDQSSPTNNIAQAKPSDRQPGTTTVADSSPGESETSSASQRSATPVAPVPMLQRAAEPTAPIKAPEGSWVAIGKQFRDLVFLLVVEQPKTFSMWPLASACAVSSDTLLTSASVATDLASFQKKGWKIWAMNQSLGIKTEVQSLRVHVGFAGSTGEPTKQIYFDLGLVGVQGKLPNLAELAAPEDVEELESGLPLACIGILHRSEQISRFESFEAELIRSRVLVVTSLDPPHGPRLLHVKAAIAPEASKPCGSVLVNAGRVVAVYAEKAEIQGDGSALQLHYAPMVERELVRAASGVDAEKVWVAPAVVGPPVPPKVGAPPKVDAQPQRQPKQPP